MSDLTDEQSGRRGASHARRGDLRHEAKDQSFRYRKDLGLPNQVCLFRHRLDSVLAINPQQTEIMSQLKLRLGTHEHFAFITRRCAAPLVAPWRR